MFDNDRRCPEWQISGFTQHLCAFSQMIVRSHLTLSMYYSNPGADLFYRYNLLFRCLLLDWGIQKSSKISLIH